MASVNWATIFDVSWEIKFVLPVMTRFSVDRDGETS